MQTPRRKLQVLLVDEEGLLREGLCAMLNQEEDLAVAGVASGTDELRTISVQTAPDLILANLNASRVDGPAIVAAARERWLDVPILVLTFSRDNSSIESALRAGADGYLLKSAGRQELLTAVHSVIAGEQYICPAMQAEGDTLSDREREVMKLIAQGLRTREIADKLSLSYKTVEKHRANLMRKLGLRTAASVAAYAISNGYVLRS